MKIIADISFGNKQKLKRNHIICGWAGILDIFYDISK